MADPDIAVFAPEEKGRPASIPADDLVDLRTLLTRARSVLDGAETALEELFGEIAAGLAACGCLAEGFDNPDFGRARADLGYFEEMVAALEPTDDAGEDVIGGGTGTDG